MPSSDEADSVLIDEARTPLIISGVADQGLERRMYETALTLAGRLDRMSDFLVNDRDRHIELTAAGKHKLEEWAEELPGMFRGERRREELVNQALVAAHLFHRDTHYLVRDQKVEIIDEFTSAPWPTGSGAGLAPDGGARRACRCRVSRTSVARITYQRFFRRYLWLAGHRHSPGGGWRVVEHVPLARRSRTTNRPVRRTCMPLQVTDGVRKWQASCARATLRRWVTGADRHALGGGSERLSSLNEAGIPHQLLNARQDQQEAEIVAQAGQVGRVTVATNMAGRGTDIVLGSGIADKGGLHVIATELHESARIDRQLYGRCGRQGDPGTAEPIVSLEDELIRLYLGPQYFGRYHLRQVDASSPGQSRVPSGARLQAWAVPPGAVPGRTRHAGIRRELLNLDEHLGTYSRSQAAVSDGEAGQVAAPSARGRRRRARRFGP
jgi:preprotein translocase subunit SecA